MKKILWMCAVILAGALICTSCSGGGGGSNSVASAIGSAVSNVGGVKLRGSWKYNNTTITFGTVNALTMKEETGGNTVTATGTYSVSGSTLTTNITELTATNSAGTDILNTVLAGTTKSAYINALNTTYSGSTWSVQDNDTHLILSKNGANFATFTKQ